MMVAAHRPHLTPAHYVLIAALDLVIAALVLTVRCSADLPVADPPPPVTPVAITHSRLRVRNVGPLPIRELVVVFPGERLRFGDIAAGATSKYIGVPRSVYPYAALRHSWEGQPITQPVTDWHGECPLSLGSFTYDLRPERYGDAGMVYLLAVLGDAEAVPLPTTVPKTVSWGRFPAVSNRTASSDRGRLQPERDAISDSHPGGSVLSNVINRTP